MYTHGKSDGATKPSLATTEMADIPTLREACALLSREKHPPESQEQGRKFSKALGLEERVWEGGWALYYSKNTQLSMSNGKSLVEMSREELIEQVKQLKKQKKFGLVWEDKPEDVVVQCQTELPVLEEVKDWEIEKLPGDRTNVIIEGDNYHALSVLNYTHAGKVDVIYIDPPYNTGAKNWKYNNDYVDKDDAYRHSKWLSMMKHRLSAAKGLLKKDGVLICAIDDNEQAHLGVLIEEIYNAYEQHTVTVVHNPKGVQGANFSYTHEYAIFAIPMGSKIISDRQLSEEEIYVSNLRNWGGESLRTDAKNCFYPIIVSNGEIVTFGDVASNDFHPKASNEIQKNGDVLIWPIDSKGVERKWRYARQSVDDIKDVLRLKDSKYGIQVMIAKDFGTYKTVWSDKRYDASEYGTKLLKKIISDCTFDFPKSLYTVYDCISAVVGNRKNALIIDFFAGSGTTGHAVMMLNKEDGGNRQFILCTNNENGIAEEVTYPRIKNVIEGYADVEGIPANVRYFKTEFVKSETVSDDTRRELLARSTEMICVKEDTYEKEYDNKHFKIYSNAKQMTGILFDLDAIEEFKEKLRKKGLPTSVYVFSLSNDTFDADFDDLSLKHKLCPIPESILEVYRKLFTK